MSKSPVLFSSDDEDEGSCQEGEVLKKFQTMLQGVPPPSSVTMSKLSVTDMLLKYKENESSFGIGAQLQDFPHKSHQKTNTTPLVFYLNSSHTSEEIANLSQKVQSRYIYSETMSSCNIWFDTVIKTNSAKKRSGRRNGFGLSPGSRLSHLARRRQIFSCENLQQLANSDKRRHIEIKKHNTLKSRTLERNETVEFEKLNSSKRALFLSPDDEETKKNISSNSIRRNLFPSSDKNKVFQDRSRTIGPSRQLPNQNYMAGSSKKRKRMESREGSGSWPRRSLTFTEEDSEKCQETNSRNAKVISELQLSLHHKSKLLWAVSVTLKERNMSSKDPQFKTCASALFMICRKNLGKILNSSVEGGTSEKMLHFAREQIGGIYKKLGICRDDNPENETLDVRNEANSLAQAENTKETLEGGVALAEGSESRCTRDDSPSDDPCPAEEVQASILGKENIDVSESGDSFT